MPRSFTIAILMLATFALARHGSAGDVVHFYRAVASLNQSTPGSQGWVLNEGTLAGTHVLKGASSPEYAWRVTDAISAPQQYNAGYSSEVETYPAWSDAISDGWRMTATARYLTDLGQGPNVGMTAYVNNREYNLLLNRNSAGVLQARLHDESPQTFALPIAATAANDFHEFQFRSVPGASLVQLYVNGSLVNVDYAWDGVSNTSHALDTMHWGNSSRAGSAMGIMDYHELVVEVGPFPTLAGDFNGDTVVDGDDLASWKRDYGRTSGALHEHGDADGDADVDGADFLVWQRQVGLSGTATTPVPEPSAAAVLTGAIMVFAVKRYRRCSRLLGLAALVAALGAAGRSSAANAAIELTERGAAVTLNGQPFAEYLIKSGHQPVIWPIIGPGGQVMTRQFPLGPKLASERDDHPHHRSLWFNHGSVNGLDFWMEPTRGAARKDNQIVHRAFTKLESQDGVARIVTHNDWTTGGEKVCEDQRTFTFSADEHGRWIDAVIDLRASEGELVLGDTKEGCFGLRVAGTMDVDAKLGGRITNSRGQKNAATWGRAAEWVDYRGQIDDAPVGIAVFDMPDSFRYPCRWHVRTYGLFAANPIGDHHFPPGERPQGAAKVAKGESLRFHYRVLLYAGELSAEQLTAIGQKYGQAGGEEAK